MQGPAVITSTSNPAVRAAAALRDRRDRETNGLSLVDGGRELRRALEAGFEIVEAFACPPLVAGDDARLALSLLEERSIPTRLVTPGVLARVAFGDRTEGLVGVVRVPDLALAALEPRLSAAPLLAVVESIEKPGNLGAILRVADGAGVDAVIAADPRTDCFNPNAIRASLGTIFTVPLAAASTPAVLEWLRARRISVVAARVDAARPYTGADLTAPVAIVLGSEAVGLSPGWTEPDVTGVRLPMRGAADSLNVATAAAILLYEARRQRDAVAT